MKKFLALLFAIVLVISMAACGSKTCESCGKEGKTKKYTIAGKSAYLCESCGALADLASGFAGLAK